MNLVMHNLLSLSPVLGAPVSMGATLPSPGQQTKTTYSHVTDLARRVPFVQPRQIHARGELSRFLPSSLGTLAPSVLLLAGCSVVPEPVRDIAADVYDTMGVGYCLVCAAFVLGVAGLLTFVAHEHKIKKYFRNRVKTHFAEKYLKGLGNDRVELICHAMDDVSGSSQNRTVVYENAENWVFTPALFDAVLSEENLKRDYSQNVFRSLLTGMGKGLTQERVKRILSIGVNSTDEKVKRCCLYLIHEASQSDEQRDCIKQLFSNVQNARQLKNLMQVTPHSSFEQLYHISSLVGSAYYRIDSNSSCPMDEWIGSVSFIGISGWVTDGPLLTKEQLTRLMSSVEMLSQIEDHSDYQRLMFTDRLVALACQMMRCLETYDTGLLHRFLTICQDKRAMGVWRQYTVNEIIKWPDAIKHLHFANPEIYSARTVDLFLELLKPGTVSHRFVLEVLSDFVSMFSKEQLDRLYLIVKGEGSFPDNLEAMALNICVRVHYALAHRAPQKGVLHATASSLTSDELKFVLEKIPLLGEDEIKKLVSWLIAVIRISDLDVTEEHKVLVDRIYQVDQALFKACPDLFILQAQIHTLK